MGILDKIGKATQSAVNSNATITDEQLRTPREPRTAPGVTAAAARLYGAEKEALEAENQRLRDQLETLANTQVQLDTAELKAKITTLQNALKSNDKRIGVQEVPLSDLFEKEGANRKRLLRKESFESLKQSIQTIGQLHAALVEEREEGGYWIVAGHNRIQALRELKQEVARVEIHDTNRGDGDLAAFISNLLQPELSTYEVYIGLKLLLDRNRLKLDKIGELTGFSKSYVSKILALEKIPVAVANRIRDTAIRLGANAIAELVTLVNDGNQEIAIKILDKISAGEGTWASLKNSLTLHPPKQPSPSKPQEMVFKRGRHSFARLLKRDKSIQISFTNSEDAEKLAETIIELMNERASKP